MDPTQLYADLAVNSVEINKPSSTFVDKDAVTKQYVDQKVSDLVDSAPGVLDTLKELASALGDDPNFATSVATQIGGLQSSVDQEISNRTQAISDEQSARAAADLALSQAQATESSARILEEQRIEAKVDQEVLDRQSAVQVEQTRAQQAEQVLLASVDALVISSAQDADTKVLAETQRAQSEEQRLEQKIVDDLAASGEEAEQARDQIVLDYQAAVQAESQARNTAIQAEADEREALADSLEASKLDKSDHYSKRSDGHMAIGENSYLYIGSSWRILANNYGPKRLHFEYSGDGGITWNVAVPFIRP